MIAKPFLTSTLLCFLAGAILGPFASKASGQELPAGPGKSDLEMVCTVCHGVDQITANGPTHGEPVGPGHSANDGVWRERLERSDGDHHGILKDPLQQAAHACRGSCRKEPGLPPKEPSAKLPLADARDLSGTWMTATWYTGLNMGPKGALPDRGVSDTWRERPESARHDSANTVG